MIKLLPSQEYLLDCFEHIGQHLIWLERPEEHFETYSAFLTWNRNFSGTVAGTLDRHTKYIRINLKEETYLAHRIVYKIHTGLDPLEIDHKNRIKHDNRFENLRSVTHVDNMGNKCMYKNNKSGYLNIFERSNGWIVQDKIKGKTVQVGRYPTLEEAIQAKKEWDEA